METLISSLIVAALSGLTFLAYKHPDAFKSISGLLHYIGIACLISITVWNTALSYAFINASPFLAKDIGTWETARAAVNTLEVPIGITIIAYISVTAFLTFLSALPKLIESKNKNEANTDDSSKT